MFLRSSRRSFLSEFHFWVCWRLQYSHVFCFELLSRLGTATWNSSVVFYFFLLFLWHILVTIPMSEGIVYCFGVLNLVSILLLHCYKVQLGVGVRCSVHKIHKIHSSAAKAYIYSLSQMMLGYMVQIKQHVAVAPNIPNSNAAPDFKTPVLLQLFIPLKICGCTQLKTMAIHHFWSSGSLPGELHVPWDRS